MNFPVVACGYKATKCHNLMTQDYHCHLVWTCYYSNGPSYQWPKEMWLGHYVMEGTVKCHEGGPRKDTNWWYSIATEISFTIKLTKLMTLSQFLQSAAGHCNRRIYNIHGPIQIQISLNRVSHTNMMTATRPLLYKVAYMNNLVFNIYTIDIA